MVKNKLQSQCGQEMVQLLEQISLENKEAVEQGLPSDLLSKANLSKAAQRNFDRLAQILLLTGSGPRADFVAEIEN